MPKDVYKHIQKNKHMSKDSVEAYRMDEIHIMKQYKSELNSKKHRFLLKPALIVKIRLFLNHCN